MARWTTALEDVRRESTVCLGLKWRLSIVVIRLSPYGRYVSLARVEKHDMNEAQSSATVHTCNTAPLIIPMSEVINPTYSLRVALILVYRLP